jgi:hypothetical protein
MNWVTYNTRILPEGNLLHAKYGLSLQYNNLRATDNRNCSKWNQTNLEVNALQAEEDQKCQFISSASRI